MNYIAIGIISILTMVIGFLIYKNEQKDKLREVNGNIVVPFHEPWLRWSWYNIPNYRVRRNPHGHRYNNWRHEPKYVTAYGYPFKKHH